MANVVNPRPSNRTFASISLTTAADGLSEAIDLTGHVLSCVLMSTAWTDARIGVFASVDNSTNFYAVYNNLGDNLTFPTSASRVVVFNNAEMAGLQRIKIISESSAGTAIAQTATRTLKLGLSGG